MVIFHSYVSLPEGMMTHLPVSCSGESDWTICSRLRLLQAKWRISSFLFCLKAYLALQSKPNNSNNTKYVQLRTMFMVSWLAVQPSCVHGWEQVWKFSTVRGQKRYEQKDEGKMMKNHGILG